ncbi:hypothetical protein ABBQ38_013430 [Trebouxia sp. C0009 RCD-2024]
MADRIAYGRLAGVSRPPFPCSAFAQSSRHRGRTPRKIVRSAAAAVDTQRTPVRVNQLLIEKDQEQLVTTEQHISSSKDSLQNDMQSVDFGPTEFSQQSTPYDAEQDWHDRFGHYGRVYTKASTVSQEGFFHPYVDTEGPLRARTIGTCPADLTTCRFSLPYKHLLPSEGEASAGDMWNCEMSMLDVDKRGWMLGPMYSMHTGQLMALMHAREYPLGSIDVDEPRNLTLSPPLLPPRHRLAGPPSTWLTGDWQGMRSSLAFHPGRFQRTFLKYSQDGRLTDMVHETYMRWAADGMDASTQD